MRMANSQALQLLFAWNRLKPFHARSMVSCTRSSAASCLRHNRIAVRNSERTWGMASCSKQARGLPPSVITASDSGPGEGPTRLNQLLGLYNVLKRNLIHGREKVAFFGGGAAAKRKKKRPPAGGLEKA